MDDQPVSKKKEIISALVVLIVIAGVVSIVVATHKKSPSNTASTTSTTAATNTNTSNSSATTSASGYKDGTYNSTASYDSPAGEETLTLTVTLANNVVTSTSATAESPSPTGKEYQQQFINAYKSLVVGKSVSDIKLSRVSGSSLTSQGFNSALDKIKTEAAA